MSTILRCGMLVVVLGFASLAPAVAGDWKLSSVANQSGSSGGGNFKPAGELAAPPRAPGMLQRMSATTRSLFVRTGNALSWNKSNRPAAQYGRRKQNKPSGFGALFRSSDKEEPRTVGEWLSLDRPESL